MKGTIGYIVRDVKTHKPMVWDYRLPIYWFKRLALKDAVEHGYVVSGPRRQVYVQKFNFGPFASGR